MTQGVKRGGCCGGNITNDMLRRISRGPGRTLMWCAECDRHVSLCRCGSSRKEIQRTGGRYIPYREPQ